MNNCMAGCERVKKQGKTTDNVLETFNNCAWICYNKLDRRYKHYWKIKRNKIIERHIYKNFED